MAWLKLRNKSSGTTETVGNRSGAAHGGTWSQGGAREDAPAQPAGQARSAGQAREPAAEPDAPIAWPGQPGEAEADMTAAGVDDAAAAGADVVSPGADVVSAGAQTSEDQASAEEPFWDLSHSEDPADDPPGGFRWERVVEVPLPDGLDGPNGLDGPDGEPAAEHADPPRPEWKPVITPVEETPGIGQRRGNLAHLAANPRMRVWRLRIIVAAVVMVAFSIWVSWQLGLTLAVIVIIADTIYRSRKNYARQPKMTRAQRRTRRQLNKLRRAGYHAMHAGVIPESEDQIDHLVVGPAGVFAIDSEAWDKHLIVRAKKGTQLWHGPFSKKDRLEHAQWEAQRAADLLSGDVGKPVSVRPAMAVYGPKIPWDVATIREVDVFSGPRLRKYLRRRVKQPGVRPLDDQEIARIYQAANKAFPHFTAGSPAS
jgi:Nuclease-related domain